MSHSAPRGLGLGVEHELPFTVDSALLRELGERIVGKPSIALAELVKNGYDADAHNVEVQLESDKIVVLDDGHGMTGEEFQRFWLRVGSTHKQQQERSRTLGRPLTGSKGIGRLAVQFLGSGVELVTAPDPPDGTELAVRVDWSEAVQAGELNQAFARVTRRPRRHAFADGSEHGTQIAIRGLRQTWDAQQVRALASQLWPLQPPFRGAQDLAIGDPRRFAVHFRSPDPEANAMFGQRMAAILDIWHARLVGRYSRDPDEAKGRAEVTLWFSGNSRPRRQHGYDADFPLGGVEFEIRIFHLRERQKLQIPVDDARQYLGEHGGVHIYDAGFRLPYYGDRYQDWLGTERDHALRHATSKLLPPEMHVVGGQTMLPVASRMFGTVHIDTGREQRWLGRAQNSPARPDVSACLSIQPSRDRLVENEAYGALRDLVRFAVDFYANEERRRQDDRAARHVSKTRVQSGASVEDVLKVYAERVRPEVLAAMRVDIRKVDEEREARRRAERSRYTSLLGALATAGLGTLAYEHEFSKQLVVLQGLLHALRKTRHSPEVEDILGDVETWLGRAREARGLFQHLLDEENRSAGQRFPARKLIGALRSEMRPLFRNVEVRNLIEPELLLPPASLLCWTTIVQNVVTNASNAMLERVAKIIRFSSKAEGKVRKILIEDNGSGVDLASAEKLFEPFLRGPRLPEERTAEGWGGTGLGLTIVGMVASTVGCTVAFVEPGKGWATAFCLSWEEQ